MTKKHSTQQLVNELDKAVEESKKLLKVQNDLSKVIEQTAKNLKDGFDSIDKSKTQDLAKFNKLLADTNKLLQAEEKNNQEKAKTEKELIKNQQELSKLRKIESQERQTLLNEQKKLAKVKEDAAKQAQKERKQRIQENSDYAKKSKRLNDLRKKYKDLAAQEKANTKTAKTLLKGIEKLDKELKEIDETVGQNQRSVGDYKKALEGLNSSLGKLGVVAIVVKGFEMLSSAFGNSRNGAEAMSLAMNKLTSYVTVLGQRFGVLGSSLQAIFSDDDKSFFEKIEDSMKAFGSSFSGVTEEAEKMADAMETQIKISTKYRIQIEELERSLSILQRTQKINLQIAENDTLSFKARERASKRAVKDAEELGKALEELGRKNLEMNAQEIAALIGVEKKRNESTLSFSNRIRQQLKDEATSRKISDDLDAQFTDSYVGYQNARLEASEVYLDTLEKQNKMYSDLNELELDLELDLLDNKKSITERKLADDKYSFEERKKMLKELSTEFDDIFQDQLETVIKQRKQVIDTEKERLRLARERGEITQKQYQAELDAFKLQEEKLTLDELTRIATIENVDEQKKAILGLELGEKFTLRYLEVIKDYRTGVIDLTEAQKKLNELQGEDENKKIEDSLKKRKELIEAGIDAIDNIFSNSNERRNNELDREASAIQKRIEDIRNAAERGNEAAKESLAAEERKQAELERKKEEQRKKEQKQEAIIAGLKLLGANADSPNALSKTVSDYTALVSIISSLPAFMDGTEKVGNDIAESPLLKGFKNDKHLVRVDGSERIMTGKQNAMLGNLTNDEVANLVQQHRRGELEYSPIAINGNKNLEDKVEKMTQSIENLHKQIPIQRVDYDARGKEHIHTIEYNNKIEKLRTKAKNVWR